ncbi:hypothetical protein BGZ51_008641 [Haplosporangium sp. Z 767]|nr:hypothetical protein BGZ50_003541 [Haplosporangium sp. Z 11]KAF9190455.1 hypothetical protein BGZ51_008641 [Haplosporangium sp. Z 767]
MAIISGQVIVSHKHSSITEISPNSRLTIQLLDVSLMDAPSTTLNQHIILTGPKEHLNFPIPFSLTYDPNQIQPHQSISISAQVVNPADTKEECLTWTSTTSYRVITQGYPTDNVVVEIEPISVPAANTPQTPLKILTGQVIASPQVPCAFSSRGIGPNSQIQIELADVSLMDVPAVTLSGQVIRTGPEEFRPFPIDFGLTYDPTKIEERNTYAVSVRVEDINEGDLTWISTTMHTVLTRGDPKEDILVEIDLLK